MKNVLLLCFVVFFASFLALPEGLINDYDFHFDKSVNGKCPAEYDVLICQNYTPLSGWLSKPFAFNEKVFIIWHLLLLTLIVPLLIFKITQNYASVLFYFGSSIWFGVYDGTVAQTFAMVWFLLFWKFENVFLRLFLLVSALLVHALAFWLLLLFWGLCLIAPFIKKEFLIVVPNFPALNSLAENKIDLFFSFVGSINFLAIGRFILAQVKAFNFPVIVLVLLSLFFSAFIGRALWVAQICIILVAGKKGLSRDEIFYSLVWVCLEFLNIFYKGWGSSLVYILLCFWGIALFKNYVSKYLGLNE
jgi:hypothetical protein